MNNMFYRSLAVLIFSLHYMIGFGQNNEVSFGGATYVSIASSGTGLSGVDAIYSNKAGITEVSDWAIDLSADQRFNLNAISSVGIGVIKNTSLGHFGVIAQKFGLEEYSQQKFGIIYAKKLFKNAALAAQFNYHNISIEEFGNTSLFNFELGSHIELSKSLAIGVLVESPISKEINNFNKIQSKISLGLRYRIDKVNILADIAKSVDFDPEVSVGITYDWDERFQARMGYNMANANFGFGFGININSIKARAGYSLNNVLGNTPSVSFQYAK